MGNETGWDLRPLATQPFLEQKNTKKLHGTKINCMHAQLGKFWTKDTKRLKNPNATFEEAGGLEQKQGTAYAPAHNTT